MTDIRCIAIDDEPIALEVIRQFCHRMGGIDLQIHSEPEEGMKAINETNPDIVFLDIEMNDISGLQIARQLSDNVCFIFTTAYMEYALDGFNLDAVDFLHKPFSYDRFVAAVDKALRRIDYMRISAERKSIVVKQEYNNVPVKLGDIEYIEAMENYSKIHIRNNRMILARNSLKSLCDQLDGNGFIRIHKSYIVPVEMIQSYTRQNIRLSSGVTLPVGRQFADNLILTMSK